MPPDEPIIDEGEMEEELIARIWFKMITGGSYEDLERYSQFFFTSEGMEKMMRGIRYLVACEQPQLRHVLKQQIDWEGALKQEHIDKVQQWLKEHNKKPGHN